MNKLKIEIYQNEAEAVIFESDECESLYLSILPVCDGFISIDGVSKRVKEGECVFDLRLLGSGKYTPVLILCDKSINLPTLIKSGKKLTLADCSGDYVRALSVRERRLEARVAELEATVQKISESISKNTIF